MTLKVRYFPAGFGSNINYLLVFNKVVTTALKYTPVVLDHHIPYKELQDGRLYVLLNRAHFLAHPPLANLQLPQPNNKRFKSLSTRILEMSYT